MALAPYIGMHFIASPLAVVTLAWEAQAWALRVALVGQAVFLTALAAGLWWGGLERAGWCVSAAMMIYFGVYFYALAQWRRRGVVELWGSISISGREHRRRFGRGALAQRAPHN